MKKIIGIILIIMLSAMLLGCENNKKNDTVQEERKELVSVEEFKEYHQIEDGEIDDEIIEYFIFDLDITEGSMEVNDLKEILYARVNSGTADRYGYYISSIRSIRNNGWLSDKPLEEFMHDANWIYIEFTLPSHDEFEHCENMMIDLRHKMIYFNCHDYDYRDADLSAKLSDEDYEEICKEFPTHMGKYQKETIRAVDYTYFILIVDTSKNYRLFNSQISPEDQLEFDEYWKGLYKKYFGKEYIRRR